MVGVVNGRHVVMVVSEPLHVLPSNKMVKLKNDEKGKNWKMQKMSEKN